MRHAGKGLKPRLVRHLSMPSGSPSLPRRTGTRHDQQLVNVQDSVACPKK